MTRSGLKKFAAVTLALAAFSGAACKDDGGGDSSSTTTKTKTTTPSEKAVEDGIKKQTSGDLDGALTDYDKAIELDPTNKFAHYNRGTVLQARNDVTGASDAYEKALTIDANYRPALYNLAILREPIAPDSSEDLYKRILAITPEDANVLLRLGLLQRKQGNNREADANLAKAVAIDPTLQAQVDANS